MEFGPKNISIFNSWCTFIIEGNAQFKLGVREDKKSLFVCFVVVRLPEF